METFTPTPPQRNRRAGRMSAPDAPSPIPAKQPAPIRQPAPAQQFVPMQQPVPVPQPAPAPQRVPLQTPAAAPQQPYAPRSAAPAPQPMQYPPSPHAEGLSAAHGRSSSPAYAACPPQPAARRTAQTAMYNPAPRQVRTAQPMARPRAAGDVRALSMDDPDARRAARQQRQPRKAPTPTEPPLKEKSAPKDQPAEAKQRKGVPGWLWSIFSLALIAVLVLVAVNTLYLASLKTAEREKQEAWENLLFEYHVSDDAADGSLRVTWQDTIERYAAVYNLDPAFVTAIIRCESSFRTDAVSSVGARGLMQMMPDTAQWVAGKLGDSYDFDRLYDAETAIRYGCWYLGYLSDIFQGDTVLVCAAYHAGQGEVWSWLGDSSISPDGVTVPIENIPISNTKTYAGRVTKAYGIYKALLYPEPAPAAGEPGAGGAAASQSAAGR